MTTKGTFGHAFIDNMDMEGVNDPSLCANPVTNPPPVPGFQMYVRMKMTAVPAGFTSPALNQDVFICLGAPGVFPAFTQPGVQIIHDQNTGLDNVSWVLEGGPGLGPDDVSASSVYDLSVHKYEGPAANLTSNGTAQTLPSNKAKMEGVRFKASRLYLDAAKAQPVDLTTNAGWLVAAALQEGVTTNADIADGSIMVNETQYWLGDAVTKLTDISGTAPFADLPVGVYVVWEDVAAADQIKVHRSTGSVTVAGSTVTPAKPFFVTLPMTNPVDRTNWLSEVHVYPKNSVDSISKSVIDRGIITSDQTPAGASQSITATRVLEYTIKATVPSLDADAIGTFAILDQLAPNARLIEYPQVRIGSRQVNPVYYVNDEVSYDPSQAPMNVGPKIEMVWTDNQLDDLLAARDANAGSDLTITFRVELTDDSPNVVPNQAFLMPSQAWWAANSGSANAYDPETDVDPNEATNPIASNAVKTVLGRLSVTKQSADDSMQKLEGAVFSLVSDPSPADECTLDDVAPTGGGTLLYKDLTTDANGLITVPGLQVSNYYDDAVITDVAQMTQYCLVETKAPEGFELLPRPIDFKIMMAGDGSVAPVALVVRDVPKNLGNLFPSTGGAGAASLALGSIVLLGGAGGYLLWRRGRSEDVAPAEKMVA